MPSDEELYRNLIIFQKRLHNAVLTSMQENRLSLQQLKNQIADPRLLILRHAQKLEEATNLLDKNLLTQTKNTK